uniref:Uncharacterized protein n=1 Tax=Meloidogyne enterolobii TaxID=390850 RepID=A0A6V7XQC6_MELEN|nr:unnamed protein product [Meloidogyne enterolobii]
MLPLYRFNLLFNQRLLKNQNFLFVHSLAHNQQNIPSGFSIGDEPTKKKENYTSVQREKERRERINQISDAMNLYIKSINEQEQFIKDEMVGFERGKRHLANIMGVDPETMTQKQINTSIKYLFPSGLFSLKTRPVMQPYSLDPIKKNWMWIDMEFLGIHFFIL